MQKKIQQVIKEVAEEHNIQVKIVEQVYKSTFKCIEQGLRDLKNVRIINLGLFTINWDILNKKNTLTKKFDNDGRYSKVKDRVGWKAPRDLYNDKSCKDGDGDSGTV